MSHLLLLILVLVLLPLLVPLKNDVQLVTQLPQSRRQVHDVPSAAESVPPISDSELTCGPTTRPATLSSSATSSSNSTDFSSSSSSSLVLLQLVLTTTLPITNDCASRRHTGSESGPGNVINDAEQGKKVCRKL